MESEIKNDGQRSTEKSNAIEVLMLKTLRSKNELLESAKKRFRSNSSGLEIDTQPDIPLSSLVGLEQVKKETLAAMRERGGFQRMLLFGSTGSGKAHLVRALATELSCSLICLNRVKVLYEWEENLEVFTKVICEICKERSKSKKSILFLKNLDFYTVSSEAHSQAVVRFLENVQQIWLKSKLKLAIIASTFQPYELDGVVVGCFNRRMYVPTLNYEERKSLLLQRIPKLWKADHLLSDDDSNWISKECFSIVASGIDELIKSACQTSNSDPAGDNDDEEDCKDEETTVLIDIDLRPLKKSDFVRALQGNITRLDPPTFKKFQAFHRTYGHGSFLGPVEREHYNYQEEEQAEEEDENLHDRGYWFWSLITSCFF